MRIAYLDCVGGISGDMLLAALLDAGAPMDALVKGLLTLRLPEWKLVLGRTRKSSLDAAMLSVLIGGSDAGASGHLRLPPGDAPLEASADPSHSPAERGHTHSHSHTKSHSHTEASDSHTHTHTAHSDSSGVRTFGSVVALISTSELPAPVKESAIAVYRRLGEAEARVHGETLESVHFHEVGAVDSIVDIVGAVLALHLLEVTHVVCSPLPNGRGFVRCAHGLMPIPPPATAELLKGVPIRAVDVEGELVTPTGAALAGALAQSFGPLPSMRIDAVGVGAGRKDFPFPNIVRVFIGERTERAPEATRVLLLEANIDDQSPQLLSAAMDALLAVGALDVWITPILMKKGRPAHTLSVLATPEQQSSILDTLFRTTSTLGVRWSEHDRECLDREWRSVETTCGIVRVKIGSRNGRVVNVAPEYEDCVRAASESGMPVKRVLAEASALALRWLDADLCNDLSSAG